MRLLLILPMRLPSFALPVLSLGLLAHSSIMAQQQGGDPQPSKYVPSAKTPIIGLWLMGQSLCDGSESLPIITPRDTGWGNLAFKRGVRTWIAANNPATPELRPADDFTFVPLTAAANGGLGETMANGLADHLTDGLQTSRMATRSPQPPRFLVSYAGQGGRMIEELSSSDESTDPRTPKNRQAGGGYYKTSLDDARRATRQAKTPGVPFSIDALVWMQGEGNGGPTGGLVPSRWKQEIPRPAGQEWYRDRLIAYRRQWSAELATLTGQMNREIPMFTYQTLGPAGEAQLMAADTDAHIHLVGVHYPVPSAINSRTPNNRHGDPIHLSADGERWWGEQVGKVVRRVLYEKENWQPLRPRKAWIAANRTSVFVEYTVPRPPLVIDTTFLPRQFSEIGVSTPENQGTRTPIYSTLGGLRITKGSEVIPITAIEVITPTRLSIHLAKPLPSSGADTAYRLSYGRAQSEPLGPIVHIRPGPDNNGQPTTEILVQGDKLEQLHAFLDEGAFFVLNGLPAPQAASAIIRHVHVENGMTILRFDQRDLRSGVPFTVGQPLITARPFAYGNVRDSDTEKATFTFSDPAYGRRQGQPYPLWNWSILFNDFLIGEDGPSQ